MTDKVMGQINFVESIKNYLKAKKIKLIANKKKLAKEDPFADMDRLNDNASVDTEANEEMGHERVEAIKAEIDKDVSLIGEALDKINQGKWGICENCGKKIEVGRLKIDPTVTRCVSCQRKAVKSQ
jgi:DnaK suppressor protein